MRDQRLSRASRLRHLATTSPCTARRPSTVWLLLSKYKFDEVAPGLGRDEADVQARVPGSLHLDQDRLDAGDHLYLRTATRQRRRNHLQARLDGSPDRVLARTAQTRRAVLLCGDFNVIPAPVDAKRPQEW